MSMQQQREIEDLKRRIEALERQASTNGYDCEACGGVGGDVRGACKSCNGSGRKPKTTLTLPEKRKSA